MGFFSIFAMNSARRNIYVHIFVRTYVFTYLSTCLQMGLLGYTVTQCLTFGGIAKVSSKLVTAFSIPTSNI